MVTPTLLTEREFDTEDAALQCNAIALDKNKMDKVPDATLKKQFPTSFTKAGVPVRDGDPVSVRPVDMGLASRAVRGHSLNQGSELEVSILLSGGQWTNL
ncbi:hypothetical protein PHISP_02568 [Aspergillus sp. HF37]|nr:hypothetical protein PHISP_02568 [Aspergillus sp. HF37]